MSPTDNRFSGFPLVVAATAGLAVMASMFATGDDWLRSEFDVTLSNANHAAGKMDRPTSIASHPVAATEDYWLGDVRRNHVTPASWNAQDSIAIGERITLTLKGVEQVLEVVAVKTGPAALLDAGSASAGAAARPLLVTLRLVGKEARPVHLILEGKEDLGRFMRNSDRPHEL